MRRLALLVLLHRRPYGYGELVAVLDGDDLFSYDLVSDAAVISRLQRFQFRNDVQVLRKLSCDIRYDRRSGCYTWHNSPFGLALTQEHLTTFALLLNTFRETLMLHADEIKALLSFFVEQLPQEQQKQLARHRYPFSIDLHETTDYHTADAHNIKRIELAIERSQQLKFTYRSLREGKEHIHVIEPQPLVFERGHVYLNGWSPEYGKLLRFRLDYILPGSADVLPKRIATSRPSPVSYVLRYELSPVIARNGVSQHADHCIIIAYHWLMQARFTEQGRTWLEVDAARIQEEATKVALRALKPYNKEDLLLSFAEKELGIQSDAKSYLKSTLIFSFDARRMQDEDPLVEYEKERRRSHKRLCSLCNRPITAQLSKKGSEIKTGIADMQALVFSNRRVPSDENKNDMLVWCPMCYLEFMLRKLSGQGYPADSDYNASYRLQLYLLPDYSFTPQLWADTGQDLLKNFYAEQR